MSSDICETFQLRYGDGASVRGEQYTDTVTLGEFQVSPQLLSLLMYSFVIDGSLRGYGQRFGVGQTYSSGSESFAKGNLGTYCGHGIQVDVGVRGKSRVPNLYSGKPSPHSSV
jgi:hypothetical protein